MPVEEVRLIAFADIDGFVKICKNLKPIEIFNLMSRYYELVGNIIEGSNGQIIKFIGDTVMMTYTKERAKEGVRALEELKDSVDQWLQAMNLKAKLSITADIGPVAYGKLGTSNDKRFDVFGQTVNNASMMRGEGLILSAELEKELAT